MRPTLFPLIQIITASLIAGCTPGVVASSEPLAQATPMAVVIPATETPSWSVPETALRVEATGEGLLVIGTILNTTGDSISQVELEAQLLDSEGNTLGRAKIKPVPASLSAGETAGFAVTFPTPPIPVFASVRVIAYEPAPTARTRVSFEITDVHLGSDGQVYLLGEVFNPTFEYARLNDLLLLPNISEADYPGAARLIPGNRSLPPRSSVLIIAAVEGVVPGSGWQTFIDVSPSGIPDPPTLVLTEPITLHLTDQGRPFHILQIQNQGSLPRWIGGQLALFADEALISLSDISSPFPLQPHEIRVFSVKTYPGLPADPASKLNSMETWRAEFELDSLRSRPALEKVLALRVEIAQFEAIGGLIFIRGTLTNDHPTIVVDPSVMVVSRDQSGRVLDSAWVSPAKELAAGDSVSFELTLMLPAGATAEMSEYDVQGKGITVGKE